MQKQIPKTFLRNWPRNLRIDMKIVDLWSQKFFNTPFTQSIAFEKVCNKELNWSFRQKNQNSPEKE